MAHPIKYIEDNLVFNHDGEVFAYYELIPYNYSFLSSDEKVQVHDNFRQLIAQNRDGKIHALQLATESSIRATQEQSKKEITGRLKEIAYEKIDEQTEALVSMIGDNQVDYRFFIGFKLLLNEQEVSAKNLDELKQRCDEVKDFYDDLSIKLVRPFGDMLGLHNEFIPSSKRYINDYIQYVTSDFLAGLGFGATQMLGENSGIYVGYNLDTGRNIYLQPSLASQGIKGSVTNALASAFIGSLGGGKSFSNNMLVYYSVLFGGQAIIVDPKAERGKWKETLPDIAHEINIVNLTSENDNKGLLDPYVILKLPKDSESLAIDILTFLTGISSRDSEKFPVLRKAIRSVTQSEQRGLLLVIDELRKEDTPISNSIADHIESFVDYDFAHLLFSDGNVTQSISLEKQLNIIQVADLVLPDSNSSFEEYTTMELLSVAMLIVISTFALDFIHSDRSIFKIVDLDEAWSFLQVAQGKALSMRLVRAGRAMNAGVYFVTQNADDLLDEKMKNNIGLKFAFRSTDLVEIKKTLEFFGVDKEDENNQKRLRELENGQCLVSDIYGRVGVMQFHPIFEELLHAFDTRPPVRNEGEK